MVTSWVFLGCGGLKLFKMGQQPKWQQIIENEDELQRYHARELMGLVKETGHIDAMPYELMLKTLDHIRLGLTRLYL